MKTLGRTLSVLGSLACVVLTMSGCVIRSQPDRSYASISVSEMGDLLVAVCADIPAERVMISERLGGKEWVKLWDAEGMAGLETGQTLRVGDTLAGLTVTSSHDAFLEESSQFNVIVVSSEDAVSGISAVFPEGVALSPGTWLYTDGTTNSDRCYFDDLKLVPETSPSF